MPSSLLVKKAIAFGVVTYIVDHGVEQPREVYRIHLPIPRHDYSNVNFSGNGSGIAAYNCTSYARVNFEAETGNSGIFVGTFCY